MRTRLLLGFSVVIALLAVAPTALGATTKQVNITGGGQEETGCTGQAPKADTWYCYVLHVKQMASSVTTDLSIDGADQSYTNHGNPQTEITSQVANVRYLRVGPRSYSGNWANPIYLDDVAVATEPLGCQ